MSVDVQQTEYGPFSSKLLCSKLSDLCVQKVGVQTGPFGTQLHKEDYVDDGTPIITVEHLGENRIVHGDTPLVSDADKSRLSKYQLLEGDIVFSRVGSVDRCALVRKEEDGWLFSGRCLRVRVDRTKLDPVYLSYFFGLEGFKKYIRSIAVGATMPSINTKILSDIPIYYPEDLEEQKRIANIFYTNDDKIELNRQTNQTLEHMAQAIFKSWFVDFEPTRAKIAAKDEWAKRSMTAKAGGSANNIKENQAAATFVERTAMAAISGRAIDSTNDSTTGALAGLDQLNPEQIQQLKTTAALFPDALVGSELGEIPEGWGTQTLEDIIELAYGKALKKTVRVEGAFPVYGSGGLTGTHNESLVEGPGIIVGRKGTVGSLYWEDSSFFPIDTVFYVKPKNNMTLIYAYSLLQTLGLNDMNTDAAVPGLNRNNAYRLGVVKAPEGLLLNFSKLIGSFREKLSINKQETSSLLEIRDNLLPKLLSGELPAKAQLPSANSDMLYAEQDTGLL